MKRLNVLLAGLVVMGTAVSCSGDDNNSSTNNNNNPSVQQVTSTVKSGTWRITHFDEEGNDETNHFNGFNFTFGDNGVLTAVNGETTHTGTWSVTNDSNSSDDDNSGSDVDFNIAFTSPDDFTDLSDDWDIVSRTNNKIVLIDVSGGNGGTDNLTFEKNN